MNKHIFIDSFLYKVVIEREGYLLGDAALNKAGMCKCCSYDSGSDQMVGKQIASLILNM